MGGWFPSFSIRVVRIAVVVEDISPVHVGGRSSVGPPELPVVSSGEGGEG